ncbi:MAG: hypothetical protein JJ920_01590 [Roseitalea sp.]|jgi:cytochrome b561|nr:hypothetical protein [Roseitalea sp.]MBO6722644.1 hypothetical protein [Roseitalea sp.]MBO6741572.1 hypothetical protein [Roseitalea sp.]
MTTETMTEQTARAAPDERPSGPPHSAGKRLVPADSHGGYAPLSIALHWLSVLFAAALVLTAWSGRPDLHALAGLVAAPFLLVHALRRLVRGFPRAPDEPAILSLAARLAIIAMLLAMIAIALSGLTIIAASDGFARLFGAEFVLPWPPTPALAAMVQSVHGAAAQAFIAAAGLHVLAALGYGARHMQAVTVRIIRPVRTGR